MRNRDYMLRMIEARNADAVATALIVADPRVDRDWQDEPPNAEIGREAAEALATLDDELLAEVLEIFQEKGPGWLNLIAVEEDAARVVGRKPSVPRRADTAAARAPAADSPSKARSTRPRPGMER